MVAQSDTLMLSAYAVDPDDQSRPLVWPLLDCWLWISRGNCWCEDRDTGRMGPLRPNFVQTSIFREMLRQAVAGVPIRIIIAKARREGSSTIVQAVIRYLTSRFAGRRAITYAHTDADTRRIFELAQRMQIHEDPDNPGLTSSITWADLDSFYECRTAGGRGVSHGSGNHYSHVSELAWIESKSGMDANALTGIIHAVSDGPHTICVIESTGNGNSGEFHDRVMRAAAGLGDFVLLFFPWNADPGYVAHPPQDFALNSYERTIRAAYDLTMPQMAWYRRKFETECGDGQDAAKVARFQREFPSTLEECFTVAKGRVYPHFTTRRHVPGQAPDFSAEHAAARERLQALAHDEMWLPEWSPRWNFYRAVDWGASHDHPFVCAWVAHDPLAPPGFSISPHCKDAIREFLDYARNEKTGAPRKEDDHVPDAVRILVATMGLQGHVCIYRLYYDRQPPPMPAIARKIHEMSGWAMPAGANPMDLSAYQIGETGEVYEATVADRSRPDSIGTMTSWGIITIPHTAPSQSPTRQGEVEDGIAILSSLMAGEAWLAPQEGESQRDKAIKALDCAQGRADPWGMGRPVALTRAQRAALAEVIEQGDADY